MDLLSKLNIENLEGEQKQLAETIGIKAYINLLQTYAGSTIYVPPVDRVIQLLRDDRIREEYDGYNAAELGRKYGLTERWVRSIVEDIHKQRKFRPVEGQISIFEETGT